MMTRTAVSLDHTLRSAAALSVFFWDGFYCETKRDPARLAIAASRQMRSIETATELPDRRNGRAVTQCRPG